MPIDFRLHDELVSGAQFDLKKTVVVFTVGGRGELHRKALATAVLAWRNLKIEPSTAIIIHVSGYDDDPRELWQIPEVRDFVQRFCAKTQAHQHPALEPTSRSLLLACGANPGQRGTVIPITIEEALRQTADFFDTRKDQT